MREQATNWVLQLFFVKRPHSNQARLVVDCQPLNRVLERPVTSFSPANEVLSQVLLTSKWFCRFDIKDSYFCVTLRKEAQVTCTFLTKKGRMRCLRIPMGLSISSDEFLSRCYLIFEGIPNIVLLIDDVLLQAETLTELLWLMLAQKSFDYKRGFLNLNYYFEGYHYSIDCSSCLLT